LFGYWLAAAAAQYPGIQVHAAVQMSNHFHLVLTDTQSELDRFMRDFLGPLARDINRLRNRRGPLFDRRYSANAIVDDWAVQDRIRYTILNPVQAGLVAEPSHWPGLNFWFGQTTFQVFERFDLAGYRRALDAGRPATEGEFTRTARLELKPAPLPGSVEEARQDIAFEVGRLQAHLKRFMGRSKVLLQQPTAAPPTPKRSPRPICHAKTEERWLWFKNLYRGIQAQFAEASHAFRRGLFGANFPRFTFRPSSTVG